MGCCISSNNSTLPEEEDNTTTCPVRKRKCTDVFFLILFASALVAVGYVVGQYAFVFGDPGRYIHGVDSWGNVCGRKDNQKIYKNSTEDGSHVKNSGLDRSSYSYELNLALSDFRNLAKAALGGVNNSAPVLCVHHCPNTSTDCADLVQISGYDVDSSVLRRRICQMPGGIVLSHEAILNRCIPQQLSALGKGLDQAIVAAVGVFSGNNGSNATSFDAASSTADLAHDLIESITQNSITLTYLLLVAIGISLLGIILLQLIARVLVITIMILAAFGTGAATAWLWYSYVISQGLLPAISAMDVWTSLISGQDVETVQSNVSAASENLSQILILQKLNQSKFLLPVAIGATVFTLISWVLLTWSRKSLWLTVQLFDEASLAIFNRPGILMQPLCTSIWLAASVIAFLVGTAYLLSDQVPVVVEDELVTFVDRPILESGRFRFIFFVFVFLWTFEFTFGCHEIILAGVVSSWFFDRSKGDKKCSGCTKGVFSFRPLIDLLRYNLGTVAFGSLVVAIVQFIRIVLLYVQKKLKNSDNKTAKFCLKCMQCCLACFEKVLKYINRNAYICVAMYGEGFCASAKRALSLLISNAQHVMILNCVSGFCLLLAKISVVAAVGAIAWIWIPGTDVSDVKFFFPLIICCVGAFVIASCFFSVFVVAIDTIFLCFCDDMQRNDGADRPYYSSKRLQSILSSGNKKTEEESNV